ATAASTLTGSSALHSASVVWPVWSILISRDITFFDDDYRRHPTPPIGQSGELGETTRSAERGDQVVVERKRGFGRIVVGHQPVLALEAGARRVGVPQVEPTVVGDVVDATDRVDRLNGRLQC